MSHPCETFANGVLEALRALEAAGQAESDMRIAEGFHPSWSADEGEVTFGFEARADNLVRLDVKVATPPRWLTQNIDLGVGAFEAGDVFGIVAEIAGDAGHGLEMFIRSDVEAGTVDTELDEPLPVPTGRGVVSALHTVRAGDPILSASRFHMLGLRLPMRDLQLDIRDMRIFVVPAARGLRSDIANLTTAAG